jgi:hypothetical protein
VYGRPFLLHDADGFTKAWYAENMGCSAEELAAVEIAEAPEPLPRLAFPPHNGYGSAEDR